MELSAFAELILSRKSKIVLKLSKEHSWDRWSDNAEHEKVRKRSYFQVHSIVTALSLKTMLEIGAVDFLGKWGPPGEIFENRYVRKDKCVSIFWRKNVKRRSNTSRDHIVLLFEVAAHSRSYSRLTRLVLKQLSTSPEREVDHNHLVLTSVRNKGDPVSGESLESV